MLKGSTEYEIRRRLLMPAMLVLLVLFGLSTPAMAAIEAVGLFKDRAMLKYEGKVFLLRVGETADNGAHLVEANAQYALVHLDNQEYRLTLSTGMRGGFQPVEKASISILPDDFDQFRVRGSINRRSVNFLVDTGASVVAMSEVDASALGVDYLSSSQQGKVLTASGEAKSYFVDLDELEVGGIRVQNVKAAVIVGSYPTEVLLGMSFLSKVTMRNENGVLTIEQ
jgi:aspartyl protease family protein